MKRKIRYSVTFFRKVPIIDVNMRFTHRWKRLRHKAIAFTKAEAVRYMKNFCWSKNHKATLRKEV